MDMAYKYKLSIIIPVYNVEQYISACLDSVVNQSGVNHNDYEVIVVNDGSPDNSLSIAEGFAAKFANIKIISRENGGLSAARNTGVESAQGEYIWFVDSDDYIAPNSVSLILEKANGIDMINIAHQEEVDGVLSNICIPRHEATGLALLAPFHAFRHDLLKFYNIKFIEGILHEDMEYTPRVCFLSKSIDSITQPLYFYRIRSGSIMTTIKPKRAFDYLTVAGSLIDFSLTHDAPLKTTPLINIICMSLNNAMYVISQADKAEQERWNNEFNKNPQFVKALKCSSVLKYKLEGYLFGMIKWDRVKLYQLLTKFKKKDL